MKTDLKSLQDSFESGFALSEGSRIEASTVINMFHNRQWGADQLIALENRGQPKETFNIIKLMTRTLQGYYATVVNKAVVEPKGYQDVTKATMLNDALKNVYEATEFDIVDDDIKMFGMLTGVFASYTSIKPSGVTDMFGRNEYKIEIEALNTEELIFDSASRKRDRSDSRANHRFRWMSEDAVKEEFGKNQATIDKLEEYSNHVSIDEAEYTYRYETEFVGKYTVDNMYLVVHTVAKTNKGLESVFWCGDIELSRTIIDYRDGLNPYTLVNLQNSNKAEYYGIFREVIEAQKAVNQALVQLQLLVNSNKVIVETDAVDDIDTFTDAVARVNGIIEVDDIKGVLIVNMSQDVLNQYTIIDNAFKRIKDVLGINDAMLGQAMASDSGRKVKLQKNTGLATLRYLTGPLELFHKRQAQLIVGLISQYYTAHQVLRVTDEITGTRFMEINTPLILPKLPPELASLVAQGMPIQYAFEAMITGQLSPEVQSAMQRDQQLQQAGAEHQQIMQVEQQQHKQMQTALVMQGKSPENMEFMPSTPAPPPANTVATMEPKDISQVIESSPQAMKNQKLQVKPEGMQLPDDLTYVYDEMMDPITGKPMKDKQGNILLIPVSTDDSKIDIKAYDITISPSSYDDEDEKAQLMMETVLSGQIGQFAQTVSPQHYAKMISLSIQTAKTKFSPEIAQMFNEMAMQLGANPQFEAYVREMSAGAPQQPEGGGQPGSKTMKLPQNTNEMREQ